MEITLTVTAAARNFADVVNRAYYRHEATTLLEDGKPVARVVPMATMGSTMRTGKEIAAMMTADPCPHLGADEATAFEADLAKAKAELPPPISPWD